MQDPSKLLKQIHILIVDDMEAIRSMIKACLRDLGASKISTTFDGEEAWKIIQNQKIDMIVCDWDMPRTTGLELLQLVRSKEESKHIPFLMLTASNEKGRVLSAVEAGVNDYLSKPFQPKELEFRVIKLLRKVNLNAPSPSSN
ncbi:PleD family two-component system response regulator [Glaciecola sp. KUL10]|uniref:response regulator n=1 Tax=Glaciecola sp. (strain KUL10) TaxID=2161813 RepID=UPI000D78A1D0|nr:response regulator [Glaciecola sp. KUL10]GBL05035.1 response regulator receiver protein [Glaciecola sp. KUL10]